MLLQKTILTRKFYFFFENFYFRGIKCYCYVILKKHLTLPETDSNGRRTAKITPEELMKLNSDKSSFVLLAFSYLHDRDVAEDIFQESILYILENRDTIEVANARWYFSRVILNKCLYYLRQSSNRARIRDNIRDSAIMAENISILSDTASDMAAFNADLSGCLEQCRRELPPLAYNIFIDAKIKGLSYKDIAEAHNVTQRRVATEMQRALVVFRRVFKDYWFLFLVVFCKG